MTAEPAEVRLGAVRVVRTFRLGRHGELYPVAAGGPAWAAGDNTATCRRRHADEVAGRRCGCGFCGYGALSVLRAEYTPGRRRHRGGEPVGPARSGPAGGPGAACPDRGDLAQPADTRRGAVPPAQRHAGRVSLSDLPSYRLRPWRTRYAVTAHLLTTVAAVVALVLVGRRAIEPGGALHVTTLDRALVWPHLPALLVGLMLVVLGYVLLARRRRVPRPHRPVLGRWFGAPLLLGSGNAVLAAAAGPWAPAVALVCALCAVCMLVTDLVPWVRLERAAPAALVRRTRVVVGERVLDTANTVAAGGLHTRPGGRRGISRPVTTIR